MSLAFVSRFVLTCRGQAFAEISDQIANPCAIVIAEPFQVVSNLQANVKRPIGALLKQGGGRNAIKLCKLKQARDSRPVRAALKATYRFDKNPKMICYLLLCQAHIGSRSCQSTSKLLRGLLFVNSRQGSPFHVVFLHGMVSAMGSSGNITLYW